MTSSTCDFGITHDHLPVGTIALFSTASSEYAYSLNKFISEANKTYSEFLESDEGRNFCGQICLVGDSVGAILAYDALCAANVRRVGSDGSINAEENSQKNDLQGKYFHFFVLLKSV